MKKFVTILLVICLALTLAACGNGANKTNTPSASGNKIDPDTTTTIGQDETPAPETTIDPESRYIRSEFTEIGEWEGVYFKTITENVGNIEDEFHLVLKDDGTGTNFRGGKEYAVTWTLNGEDFRMTELDSDDGKILSGTMYAGVLHLYDGDIYDLNTIEYIYGKGDLSGIYIPGHDELFINAPFDRIRGDWYGVYGLRACFGDFMKYEDMEDMAIARFIMNADGSYDGFVGLAGEIEQIKDFTITENATGDEFYINGTWNGIPFEGTPIFFDNGNIDLSIYLFTEGEDSTMSEMHMEIVLRKTSDITWSSTDIMTPDDSIIEKAKTMSFEDMAAEMGFSPDMYPKTPIEMPKPLDENNDPIPLETPA